MLQGKLLDKLLGLLALVAAGSYGSALPFPCLCYLFSTIDSPLGHQQNQLEKMLLGKLPMPPLYTMLLVDWKLYMMCCPP